MIEWKADVSDAGKEACVRGVPLEEVMDIGFADAIWLIHRGETPTDTEVRVFTAILSGCIDHGVGNPHRSPFGPSNW